MSKKDNLIVIKTFEFALKVIELYKQLLSENEYIISKQLLKSGTSIGANIEEAIAAQSRKDFVSKMSIASKEARETDYWLRLLKESNLTQISVEALIKDINDIINILSKIIITTKMR
ncbi:MAG: four helix bundle protein [Psychroflexus halocasei]|uniref:four helix bundle protein n=1 Tax=Psychroflexus sp. S27 TaxID=1982757 RepID=UPI000C2AF3B9|nr:four helix bundle protein [Psychroflexus sp. S27]PJX24669.1 four helix bundle protein [Psychroflexus sp. S27]